MEDFTKYFYIMTISFANAKFVQSFISDQVFSFKWGAYYFDMPSVEKDCFFSLFQQNDRFMGDGAGEEDYEYAEMQLIVTKVIKIPPKEGKNNVPEITGECAYIDGLISDLYNCCHLKIDKLTAGRYVVFFTAKFKKQELCRKINNIVYSPHHLELHRISAKNFGKNFIADLERRNFNRNCEDDYK